MAFDYNQLIAPGIGATAAIIGSAPQWQEAQRLKKERERLLKEGPPGMSPIEDQQINDARAAAASGLAPGDAEEKANIAQGQADILGAGKKAGLTGSHVMNLLARLNQQGQAARRNLVIRGAQAQRQAKADYRNIAMNADARRQNRVQNWEGQLAAMDAARREYRSKAAMAPLQGAAMFMPTEGFKFGGGKTTNNSLPLSLEKGVGDFPEYEAPYNPFEPSVYNTTG